MLKLPKKKKKKSILNRWGDNIGFEIRSLAYEIPDQNFLKLLRSSKQGKSDKLSLTRGI